MPKVGERSVDLLVHEPPWTIEGRDPARHAPRNPEMPSPPGHIVAEGHPAGGDSCDRSFFRSTHRLRVYVHVKRQVESLLGRTLKLGGPLDKRHRASSARLEAIWPSRG